MNRFAAREALRSAAPVTLGRAQNPARATLVSSSTRPRGSDLLKRINPGLPRHRESILAMQRTLGNAFVLRLMLQRPRGAGRAVKGVRIRGKQVKELIKARNLELYQLIANNRLDGKFVEVRREVTGGEQTVWYLSVRYQFQGLGTGGRTAEIVPVKTTSRGKPKASRYIYIEVNPFRLERPELIQQIPDPQQRLESMAAETLLHELVHAQILIGRALPGGAAPPAAYTDFSELLQRANSPALRKEKTAVLTRLRLLVGLAQAAADAGARTAMVEQVFEALINEKFAAQTAGKAFGRTRSNASLAGSYCKEYAGRIAGKGTAEPDKRTWDLQQDGLCRSLEALYDRLDAPSTAPKP